MAGTAGTAGITIDTPEGISFAQLAARKGALKLECLGMKSRGGSVYALCKREYGLKGSKQKVLEQMQAMVDEAIAS